MDPAKLAEFTQNKLILDVAERFVCQVVNVEMPGSLKRYLELELFPQVALKVGKGISLRTARPWLHREGFKYTAHKKALYYDGHKRADVIKFRQEYFYLSWQSIVHDTKLEMLTQKCPKRPQIMSSISLYSVLKMK